MNKITKDISYESEFSQITGLSLKMDSDYKNHYDALVDFFREKDIRPLKERYAALIGVINKKLDLNANLINHFYSKAVDLGYTFNFHQKNSIQEAFDFNDQNIFEKVLHDRKIGGDDLDSLKNLFNPITDKVTLTKLKEEADNPSKLRIQDGKRDIKNEIALSLFSAFLWTFLSTEEMHSFFDPKYSSPTYKKSFWKQLQTYSSDLFNRENALHVLRLDHTLTDQFKNISEFHPTLTKLVANSFEKINNHGILAVLVDGHGNRTKLNEWELVSDLILIAEKFREVPLKKNYFQWKKIEDETTKYIKHLDKDSARFDLVNEGFTYKDTFVLSDKNDKINKILVIFQKNDRDDTLIPCPSCRSAEVQGNSYSSLGVKSWECDNPLCPDRSKYNRGKRYSFRGLLMQEAIQIEENTIPKEVVKKWQKDVVRDVEDKEILEMLIRHYSLHGDTVYLHNWKHADDEYFGRKIIQKKISLKNNLLESFFNINHFTKRYLARSHKEMTIPNNIGDEDFQIFCGDASNILRGFEANIFDGAVTSPPYYNAREYSQWANIYCYLHDMFDINEQVFKTLKPGAYYLYNIFDYFDNENTVTFSAMGQKRMILSAYTVDLFRKIGFEVVGNIVWDKGDIEGKRGFNAGNFSPFYQAPFNCWEHILVFRKPGKEQMGSDHEIRKLIEQVFRCKPVMKMVKGKNTHGHTAPFPDEIPGLIASILQENSTVLDPFGGSLTTGRVSEKFGHRSVSVELSPEYCNLGMQMRQNQSLLPLKKLSKKL